MVDLTTRDHNLLRVAQQIMASEQQRQHGAELVSPAYDQINKTMVFIEKLPTVYDLHYLLEVHSYSVGRSRTYCGDVIETTIMLSDQRLPQGRIELCRILGDEAIRRRGLPALR
jgi:hypothetical protein